MTWLNGSHVVYVGFNHNPYKPVDQYGRSDQAARQLMRGRPDRTQRMEHVAAFAGLNSFDLALADDKIAASHAAARTTA